MRGTDRYDDQGMQTMHATINWRLVLYDFFVYLLITLVVLVIYPSYGSGELGVKTALLVLTGALLIFGARFLMNVYRQVWRYGGMRAYILLITADMVSGLAFLLVRKLPCFMSITLPCALVLVAMNLLLALTLRIVYQYVCQTSYDTLFTKVIRRVFRVITGRKTGGEDRRDMTANRIKAAIIGAGQAGVSLAEDMLHSQRSLYVPVCFVDSSPNKAGREIYGLPIYPEDPAKLRSLFQYKGVQEAVIALPGVDMEKKKALFDLYRGLNVQVKVYDYPTVQEAGQKRQLRDFDISELLFRTPKDFLTEEIRDYYRDKSVLVTGGGGSIGSEMCRQIAKMRPKELIIYDIYENGAYDLQQELKTHYGKQLNLCVEISTLCDNRQLDRIFRKHRPDIVIHAAAHKHVPLCQQNPIEAVSNNVFGTENLLNVCDKYGVKRFMMVSTDKAVNPTNIMGATKRMCEMMVLNHQGNMAVSATRFGNVLGSSGSVIPLFRRQIQNGGPVTITDKRIIRYFMTIPEASQLVLASGAMAKNRELFVLDMGKPVRILDLAESMIRLSGLEPYKDIEIVEIGLRPGEKLYEELLIRSEQLEKTDNELIYIEHEEPENGVPSKLRELHQAVDTQDPNAVKTALRHTVPTYKSPDEINAAAGESEEMKMVGMAVNG